MPAAAVPFSYAQAAKGQMAASGSTSPSTAPTPVTGTLDHQIKDELLDDLREPTAPAADARNDESETMRNSKEEAIPAASVSDASCTTNNDTLGSSGTSSNDSRRDDDTNSEVSARRTVHDTRSHGSGSRASQSRPASTSADSRRPRRERRAKGAGNSSKSADKDIDAAENTKEAPPKVELFDSPIPSVNPWQQRQVANAKQGASESGPSIPNTAMPAQSSTRKGAGATSSNQTKPGSDAVLTNGLGIHRKGGEGDVPRKNGFHYKNDSRRPTEQLPSSDSSHWPTPQTANKDQKPQRSADNKSVEHLESSSQDESAAQKGKPKNWVKMDFVPTVSFQTPIPPKGTRPRGGARGPRDGTSRGGHSANAAKDGEKGSGPSTNSTKVNGDAREGAREPSGSARGSSVPPSSTKRGSADAPNFRDQRKQSVPSTSRSKDAAPNEQSRDRHENRSERARGGPRARGGYHGSAPHPNAQHNTFNAGYPSSVTSRHQNPYSPPVRQNQFNSYGSASSRGGSGRGGRGGSNATRAPGSNNGNGRHAPYSMMTFDHSFHNGSVMGYQIPSPAFFLEPWVVAELAAQLGWYFSVQNLCGDMFLRSNMDSQGFVPVSLVLGFNRVTKFFKQHPVDPVQYVRQACTSSLDVEFVVGDDGVERMRTLHDPLQWVRPMEERVETARNAGPASFASTAGIAHGGFPAVSSPMNSYPPLIYSHSNPISPERGPDLANGLSVDQGTGVGQATTLKPTVPEFSPQTVCGDKMESHGADMPTPPETEAEAASSSIDGHNRPEHVASS